MKKIFTALTIFISFIALAVIAYSQTLSVTCEAGGPYVKTATKIVRGEVLEGSKGVSATVTVNITGQNLNAETTSNNAGKYSAKFTGTLDAGNYTANVTASNNTHVGSCNDTFQVRITEVVPKYVQKSINVTGIAVWASTGKLVSSGNLTASIVDENIRNDTAVVDGKFSVILAGSVKPAERYLVQLHVVDSSGAKENWSHIIIAGV